MATHHMKSNVRSPSSFVFRSSQLYKARWTIEVEVEVEVETVLLDEMDALATDIVSFFLDEDEEDEEVVVSLFLKRPNCKRISHQDRVSNPRSHLRI